MLRLKPSRLSIPIEYGKPSPNDGLVAGRWYENSFDEIHLIRLNVSPQNISPIDILKEFILWEDWRNLERFIKDGMKFEIDGLDLEKPLMLEVIEDLLARGMIEPVKKYLKGEWKVC